MTKEKRELIADRPFSVMKVRVTHPAGLHSDDRFTGTGVRDDQFLDPYRLPLRRCNHTTHSFAHQGKS